MQINSTVVGYELSRKYRNHTLATFWFGKEITRIIYQSLKEHFSCKVVNKAISKLRLSKTQAQRNPTKCQRLIHTKHGSPEP
jgi:hypothetical protein